MTFPLGMPLWDLYPLENGAWRGERPLTEHTEWGWLAISFMRNGKSVRRPAWRVTRQQVRWAQLAVPTARPGEPDSWAIIAARLAAFEYKPDQLHAMSGPELLSRIIKASHAIPDSLTDRELFVLTALFEAFPKRLSQAELDDRSGTRSRDYLKSLLERNLAYKHGARGGFSITDQGKSLIRTTSAERTAANPQ